MSDFFDPDEWESKSTPKPASTSFAPIPAPVSPATPAPQAAPLAPEVKQTFFDLKPVAPQPTIRVEPLAIPQTAATSTRTVEPVAPAAEVIPVRMPEPIEIPTDFPSFEAPDGMHVDLSDLGIGSEGPLTRRQLRERARLTGDEIIEDAPTQATPYEARLPYDDDLVEQLPELAQTTPIATVEDTEAIAFEASPGMLIEPVTNSIVIDHVQDLTNYTATIDSTGEILTTGSIQIPFTLPDTSTGEIKVIEEAQQLDAAIQTDNAAGFINSVAPMRVTGIVQAMSRSRVIPVNLRRGKQMPMLALSAGVLILGGFFLITAVVLKLI